MAYRRSYFTDGQVTSPAIVPGAITEEKIADNAVTSAKIKDETITGADIGAGQVQTDDIADGAVTLAKLGSNVSLVPLQDGAVTEPKIADSAVSSSKLRDASITPDKLALHAVTSTKLNDGAVTSSKIGIGEVTPTKLAAIDSPADGEVPTYNQVQAKLEWKPMSGGITRPLVPPVTSDELQDDSVVEDKIKDNAVTADKIAGNAVTPPKIDAVNSPADGQVLSYENASSRFKYITPSGGDGSKLTLFQSHFIILWEQSNTNIDQLIDLTSFIPATATAVILEIQFNAMSVPSGLEQILTVYGRRAGTDWGQSTVQFIWQNVANLNNNLYKECVVATDADRKVRVIINKNSQFCSTNMWIKGYIE
ncbi:MAG: hypothetical protein V1701_12455 [Planctomycetota bacterium]